MSVMKIYYVTLNEAFNKKSAKNRNEIDDTYFLILKDKLDRTHKITYLEARGLRNSRYFNSARTM